MLEKADVVGHAVAALGNGGEAVQDAAVRLSGIGLATDGITLLKAEFCGDLPVHLVNLGAVSIEQVHKAGLCAGGAPAAQELHVVQDEVQLLQVGEQVLHPEGGPLAHRHQLGGLIVGIAQGGGGLVLLCKFTEVRHHSQQLSPEIPQALPVDDEIRVVGDIAAGGPQVDDPRGGGGRLAVGVDVGHHVVADLLLPRRSRLIVDVGDVGLQLRHLLRGDGQAQIVLCPGQGHPQPPPGLKAHVGGEQVQHERRGVPGRQGGFVTFFGHKRSTFLSLKSLGGTGMGASRGYDLFRRRRSIYEAGSAVKTVNSQRQKSRLSSANRKHSTPAEQSFDAFEMIR